LVRAHLERKLHALGHDRVAEKRHAFEVCAPVLEIGEQASRLIGLRRQYHALRDVHAALEHFGAS
jgi:hypothetical protein